MPNADTLNVEVSPANPGPHQQVNFTLTSYSTNLNQDEVGWYVNNTLEKKGAGITSFSMTTGALGNKTTVEVVVATNTGNLVTKDIVLVPAEVDILWDSNSAVPPFYKGKALYPDQGTVTLTAMPNMMAADGTRLKPSDLVYTWKQDGQILGDGPVFGSNTISLSGSVLLESFAISVEVSTPDNSVVADGQLRLNPIGPGIIMYQNDPLYGILFNEALPAQTNLASNEIQVSAFPYFYSTDDVNSGNINYAWTMNGSAVSNTSGGTITLRNTNSTGGSSALGVTVANSVRAFQSASRSILINFSKAAGTPSAF
jgi:hypothetical protein